MAIPIPPMVCMVSHHGTWGYCHLTACWVEVVQVVFVIGMCFGGQFWGYRRGGAQGQKVTTTPQITMAFLEPHGNSCGWFQKKKGGFICICCTLACKEE